MNEKLAILKAEMPLFGNLLKHINLPILYNTAVKPLLQILESPPPLPVIGITNIVNLINFILKTHIMWNHKSDYIHTK